MSDDALERDNHELAKKLAEQIQWGLSAKEITSRDKVVMLALIFRANRINGHCYRSLSDLAADTDLCVTSVSKSVRNLKDHKLIVIEQRGKQLKNFYAIKWPGYDE